MDLHQKIVTARNQLGLTQEELAAAANVTVRTIQRIESGDSIPRKYTLKLIASALQIPFDELNATNNSVENAPATTPQSKEDQEADIDFLRLLCLSCFSYVLIPYIHFLIPSYLLKKRSEKSPVVVRFGRKLIQTQIYWVIGTTVVFLLVLAYNFIQAAYLGNQHAFSYVAVFFFMYFLNVGIIGKSFFSVNERLFYTV
jgi:transcriptional regulator with XRE-family HTH domain